MIRLQISAFDNNQGIPLEEETWNLRGPLKARKKQKVTIKVAVNQGH